MSVIRGFLKAYVTEAIFSCEVATKLELEILFPKLANRGVLIIDDYGHWEGARKAVDEYFSNERYKPFFNVIDYTGRSAIKIEV